MNSINAYLTALPVELKLFIMLTCIVILVIAVKTGKEQ